MKSIKLIFSALIGLMLLPSVGCDRTPRKKEDPSSVKERIVFTTTVVSPGGQSGSTFLSAIGNMEPAKYTNDRAIPTGFGTPPIILGEHIYSFPDYMGSSKAEIVRYSLDDKLSFHKEGALSIPGGSSPCNIIEVNEEKAYLSLQGLGIIFVFNPKTMKKTGEIDLNMYKNEKANVAPGAMVLRDGYVFVGLCQFGPSWMPVENAVEVAVIDANTDKAIKKISNHSHKLSVATRPIDKNSIFVDERGDIYINCIGSFGFNPAFPGGIVRIKKGQMEIDPDYMMQVNQIPAQGISYSDGSAVKFDYFSSFFYGGNGKLYAFACAYALDPENQNPYTALTNVAVEIDLAKKEIKRVPGIPITGPFSVCIERYKHLIVFSCHDKKNNGFFTYNPKSGVSKGPVIEVQGDPTSFYWMRAE